MYNVDFHLKLQHLQLHENIENTLLLFLYNQIKYMLTA